MSLLAKMKWMGALLMSLFLFNACEESGEFGFVEDDVTPVEFVSESIDIESGIVLMDSVRSSEVGRVLFGQLNDNQFGTSKVTTYIGLNSKPTLQPFVAPNAVLDSVEMNIQFIYILDSLEENRDVSISVSTIDEPFPSKSYKTSDVLEYGDRLLGSGEFTIGLNTDSTYTIPLDQSWGEELFSLITNRDESITNLDLFRFLFPGFAIGTNSDVNNIFGITTTDNFEVKFYYSETSPDGTTVTNEELVMDADKVPSSYAVDADRSNSNFFRVDEPSTSFQANFMGAQAGAGLVTKINLSNLEDFFDQKENKIIINLAELTIGPIEEVPEGRNPPEFLFLFITDELNTLIPSRAGPRAIQSDGSNPIENNRPVQLQYNEETNSYRGSITSYIQVYNEDIFRRNELFLYPSNMNDTFSSILVKPENINFKVFFSQVR